MGDRTLTVRPVSGALGAEVAGVDLAQLGPDEWQQLHALWLEHLVLFFPGQRLTPDDQVALARRLGEPEINPFIPKLDDGHPEVVVLDSIHADRWHTDVTFSPTPPIASVLLMEVCPPVGGDTMWTNQYLAFESLSPPIREFLSGLTAVHHAAPMGRPDITTRHPVVRIHPETQRRSLYVNRGFTSHLVEVSRAESDVLLEHLFRWSERPELQCRYQWSEGTLAIWDNRCTQHYGVADYTERRVLHRVTVLGDHPVGDDPRWSAFDEATNEPPVRIEADPRTNSITA